MNFGVLNVGIEYAKPSNRNSFNYTHSTPSSKALVEILSPQSTFLSNK